MLLRCSFKASASLTAGGTTPEGLCGIYLSRCCPWTSLGHIPSLSTFQIHVYQQAPTPLIPHPSTFFSSKPPHRVIWAPEQWEKAAFGELGTAGEKHQPVQDERLRSPFTSLVGGCWAPLSYVSSDSLVAANCFDIIKNWPRLFAVLLFPTGSGEAIPRKPFFLLLLLL